MSLENTHTTCCIHWCSERKIFGRFSYSTAFSLIVWWNQSIFNVLDSSSYSFHS